jgi:DNA-binding SARP family transcriptional activator
MPGASVTTELRLLGDVEVRAANRKIALPASKKTRALLGYLALTQASQLREHLCDLLFQGPDDPRAALRWSLTKLRGVLGEARIVADRERVSFDGAKVTCDVTAVRTALAGGARAASTEALKETLSRFRGELLEGLDLPDCYRYHEWCIAEREALRKARVEVLVELVERHAGEPVKALAFARQRLAIDPITEGAHVAVVQILSALGRNAEAAEQVEACRRILSRELGAKPSAALLAARVRAQGENRLPSTPPPPQEPASPQRESGPTRFVGRDDELAALDAAWSEALAGRAPRTVLVTGEPGIGKTRLLSELGTRVVARGGHVLHGRAFEAEMVRPYGPWVDALGPSFPDLSRAEAADRTWILGAVVDRLGALAGSAGCLVSLDDLQWFDEASLTVLHFVARSPAAARVLVTCTARGDELLESSAAIRCVRAMQKDDRLTEIRLGALDAARTAELARAIDDTVDDAQVVARSAGNPLFALELARAKARGVGSSESLDALLADRLDRLEARAQEMVPWAAALGRSFRADLLALVTGASDVELLGALTELERRGVLRADAGAADAATYDFVHDLVRDAAYKRLSSPRRQVLHRAIAKRLAEHANAEPALHGDVAHHAALAGDHPLATQAAIAAADRCLRMFASEDAARLAESGMVHADRLDADERVRAHVALLGVKVRSGLWLRRAANLGARLTELAREAEARGLGAEAGRALSYLSYLQREHGDLQGARNSSHLAVSAARDADAESRGLQLSYSARCLALIDRDMEQASSMIEQAASLLPGHERDFEWCWAHALERDYRDAADAGECLERARRLACAKEERFGEFECLMRLVQRELERGSPAQALAWCRELGPVAAKMTDGSEGVIADALDALGRVACCVPEADGHLEGAIARLRDVDAKGMLSYVLSLGAEIDREARRYARAAERAREALAAAQLVDRRSCVAWARACLAELAADEGDPASARHHVDAVAADLGRPMGVSARARKRIERAASRLAPAPNPSEETHAPHHR